jgi:VWFA-related protein
MRARSIAILSFSCLLAAIVMIAQDVPSDEFRWGSRPYNLEVANAPAIRVQSDLVEIPTVVRDSHGNPIGDLTKDDFILLDNGKPQTISMFTIVKGTASSAPAVAGAVPVTSATTPTATVEPRYVALFFDDANTSASNLNFARDGAVKFIRKGLDPGERVGIFVASGTLTLDFTDDVPKLLETLTKLHLFERMPNQGAFPCPPLDPYQAWVIVHEGSGTDELRDAITAARDCCGPGADSCAHTEAESVVGIAENYSLDTLNSISYLIRHLGEMQGHRVLLLASSGFLTMSFGQQQQKVIEAALRANVVINSMDTSGLRAFSEPYGSHFNLVSPLSDMAAATGGKFMHNGNDLEAGFRNLSDLPSVSYILGFSPVDLKDDGTMHKLKVKLADSAHLTITARPGYLAPSAEIPRAEKKFRKLQQYVTATDNPTEVPIEFAAVPETLPGGESSLRVTVHVDIRKLPFLHRIGNDDRHIERLIFITALFDSKNQFLTGVEGVMDLRLKKTTMKQLSAQGIDGKLSIQAPAGTYRVRQVVQEAVTGRVAALSRAVEIH